MGITSTNPVDHTYSSRGKIWYTSRLIEYSKDLPKFDLPLKHVDLDVMPFDILNILDMALHTKRIISANLDYPVIMSDTGYICNGWHRIAKALIEEIKFVVAVRFEEMPPFDKMV